MCVCLRYADSLEACLAHLLTHKEEELFASGGKITIFTLDYTHPVSAGFNVCVSMVVYLWCVCSDTRRKLYKVSALNDPSLPTKFTHKLTQPLFHTLSLHSSYV